MLDEAVAEDELCSLVQRLNEDPLVDGILVQLPLPEHINQKRVLEAISVHKDVDGFHPCVRHTTHDTRMTTVRPSFNDGDAASPRQSQTIDVRGKRAGRRWGARYGNDDGDSACCHGLNECTTACCCPHAATTRARWHGWERNCASGATAQNSTTVLLPTMPALLSASRASDHRYRIGAKTGRMMFLVSCFSFLSYHGLQD